MTITISPEIVFFAFGFVAATVLWWTIAWLIVRAHKRRTKPGVVVNMNASQVDVGKLSEEMARSARRNSVRRI
jgi:hypothetical protein